MSSQVRNRRQLSKKELTALWNIELDFLLSRDIKAYKRWKDTCDAHAFGITLLAGLAAWPIGRRLANHFPSHRSSSVFWFRTATLGTLAYSSYQLDYHFYLLRQRNSRVKFIMENIQIYTRWKRTTRPSPEKEYITSTLQQWYTIMTRDPLWRNQAELDELAQSRLVLGPYLSIVLTDRHQELRMQCIERYLVPALEKTYNVDLKSLGREERMKTAELLMVRGTAEGVGVRGAGERGRRAGERWSLGVPDEKEEFLAWMEDETTGRPVRMKEGWADRVGRGKTGWWEGRKG